MIIKHVLIEKYNQKGEGVGFYQNKPIYIFGTIISEIVDCEIVKNNKNYLIGRVVKFIKTSENRSNLNISNAHEIGGYELIHMNELEQKGFKINRVKNDFSKIAKIDLNQVDYFEGKQKFYYRNKITLHDGFFYKKNSHIKIDIPNYLLSDIQYDKTKKGKIIYRKLDSLIYGKKNENKYTTDSMFGFVFRVGLNSFYQINKEIALEVYKDIKNNVIKNGITVDLFAGIATITIIVANVSKKVYGVEINKNSYKDAIFNIKKNNVKNIFFELNDVNKWIIENQNLEIDTLILDPSREGISNNTIQIILNNLLPKRIIYLSCNPGTQAANINSLKSKYKITKIKIYDMFPQTYHIESLVILEKY